MFGSILGWLFIISLFITILNIIPAVSRFNRRWLPEKFPYPYEGHPGQENHWWGPWGLYMPLGYVVLISVLDWIAPAALEPWLWLTSFIPEMVSWVLPIVDRYTEMLLSRGMDERAEFVRHALSIPFLITLFPSLYCIRCVWVSREYGACGMGAKSITASDQITTPLRAWFWFWVTLMMLSGIGYGVIWGLEIRFDSPTANYRPDRSNIQIIMIAGLGYMSVWVSLMHVIKQIRIILLQVFGGNGNDHLSA